MTSSTSTTGRPLLPAPAGTTSDRFPVIHGKGFWAAVAGILIAMALLATWAVTQSTIDGDGGTTTAVSGRISPNAADYSDAQRVNALLNQRVSPNAADYRDAQRVESVAPPVSPNAADYRDARGMTSTTSGPISPNAVDYRESQKSTGLEEGPLRAMPSGR